MSLDHDQVVQALPAYQLEGEIGRGGWGVVLSATHRELGRRVAIKQLPRAFGADPAVRTRFKEEARLVASLTHPHIVPVFDFVEHDGLCLIVMELLTGGTLWDRFLDEGVPLDDACALLLAASAALQHAHSHGILHRDIKPENFLFSDTGIMKLGDFGIAKVIGQAAVQLTVAGSVMGTPAYMAPEQALGQKLGPGTDIYSLGVMLYELASGDLPFPETDDPLHQLIAKTDGDPRPLRELRPDIHPELDAVIMQAISRRPEDRQPTAQDLGLSLARAATVAFGAGWLRQCGVEVMSAPQMIALTEQSTGTAAPAMRPSRITRATSVHSRIGDLVTEPGTQPAPPPGATPGDLPAVIRPSSGATIAPDWAGAGATAPAPLDHTPTSPTPTSHPPTTPPPAGRPPTGAYPVVGTAPPAPTSADSGPATGPWDPTSYPTPASNATPPPATVYDAPLAAAAPSAEPVTAPPPAPTFEPAPTYEPPTYEPPAYEAPAYEPPPPPAPVAPVYEPPPASPAAAPVSYERPATEPPPVAYAPPAYEPPPVAYEAPVAPPYEQAPAPAPVPPAYQAPPPAPPAYPPPVPTGPPPGSPGEGTRGKGRVVLVVLLVVVVLAAVATGAVILTRGGGDGTATPPGSVAPTTAPGSVSTTVAETTTTVKATTTTTAPTGPQITDFKMISPSSVSITWKDTVDPTAAHVLVAYSTGPKEQHPVTDSPQDVNFTAGAAYCFEITAIGATIRRSEPKCVNGADPAVLVKHDDPFKATTSTTP